MIVAGAGARVTGSGTTNDPMVIDALPISIVVQDSDTVDMTLTGTGTAGDPWVLSATIDVSSVSSLWTVWNGDSAAFAALTPSSGTVYVVDDS